jgi:perosamine synthetase
MTRRLARVPGLTPPYRARHGSHTYMLYTCLIDTGRDDVLRFLLDRGIEARVYFPPVHRQAIFAGRAASLPVTDAVAARMLSVPMHSLLQPDELAFIADTLAEGVAAARAPR